MPAEGLRQRFWTSIVVAAVLMAVFFLTPSLYGVVLLGLLVLAGAWEWGAFFRRDSRLVQAGYVVLITLALVLAWWFARPQIMAVLWVAMAWWTLAFFWVLRFPTPIPLAMLLAGGLLVLVPGWLALAVVHTTAGPQWLIFFFVVIAAADTGAYFSGRRFGRTRLAPKVSPGKTWEGVAGGQLLVIAVALVASFLFALPPLYLVPLCMAVALVSIVGDLTMSMFKRHAGLKDSGKLFPGHGGVLDRIDSLAAGAPLYLIGLGWTTHIT